MLYGQSRTHERFPSVKISVSSPAAIWAPNRKRKKTDTQKLTKSTKRPFAVRSEIFDFLSEDHDGDSGEPVLPHDVTRIYNNVIIVIISFKRRD